MKLKKSYIPFDEFYQHVQEVDFCAIFLFKSQSAVLDSLKSSLIFLSGHGFICTYNAMVEFLPFVKIENNGKSGVLTRLV